MSSLAGKTILFESVYLSHFASVAGPIENQGPLHEGFDWTYDDLYAGEKTFEKAERAMQSQAQDLCLKKAKLLKDDLFCVIGGDLENQLVASSFSARHLECPFIGVYAACATSALGLGLAGLVVEAVEQPVMVSISSHNATAERQYRYPVEYGIQKKPTCTYTATGAASFLLSHQKASIRLVGCTLGRIIDYGLKDANDMGAAMAPAAYDTIKRHLASRQQTCQDYDLIVTGDLSGFGAKMLKSLFQADDIDLSPYQDCGLMLYDVAHQKVYQGGSGAACSALVLASHLLPQLLSGQIKHLLYVPTGALLSQTSTAQKETIPCIAHAIEWEVCQ